MAILSTSCSDRGMDPDPLRPGSYPVLEPIRLAYGDQPKQFGDLRMPDRDGPVPVILILHGGCWLSFYDLSLTDAMARELTKEGYATWNVEYRGTSDPGGGWPGTFTDVALALRHLKELARSYPLDLDNILLTGHSAGGHLALMLGAQHRLASESDIRIKDLPNIRGIVSLAGITDLSTYYTPTGCGSNVRDLIGGLPDEYPQRYAEGSPVTHLPLGVHQILISGAADNIVPPSHISPYFISAKGKKDVIDWITVPDAGHFELTTPGSVAWDEMLAAYKGLLK